MIAALGICVAALVLVIRMRRRRKSPEESGPYVIDGVLTLHDAMEGVIVTGGPGSGKSTTVLTEIFTNILATGAGVLWLAAKTDEFQSRVLPLSRAVGRFQDVIRVAPDEDECCDILNLELSSPGGSIDSCAALLDAAADLSCRSKPRSGGDDAFWARESAKGFRRAIAACYRSTGRASIVDVYRMFNSAPTSPQEVASPDWRRRSFCWAVMEQGFKTCPTDDDFALAATYWLQEWPALDPKTRGICLAMATGALDPFMNGPMMKLVAGGTTTGPQDVLAGKIVCIDMPTLRYQEQGILFGVLMKLLVQRAAMRRDVTKDSKVVAIFADEAHNFVVSRSDMMVSTMARSSKLIMVNCMQNLPLMYASLGGDHARQEVDAWLSCHMCKIALANPCPTTGEYYSKLYGSSFRDVWNGSSGQGGGYSLSDDVWGRGQKGGPTVGWSQHWHPEVPSEEFSKLSKPTPARPVAEGYIHLGGKLLDNGRTWGRIDFKQRFFPKEPPWQPKRRRPAAAGPAAQPPPALPAPEPVESIPTPEPQEEVLGEEFNWL